MKACVFCLRRSYHNQVVCLLAVVVVVVTSILLNLCFTENEIFIHSFILHVKAYFLPGIQKKTDDTPSLKDSFQSYSHINPSKRYFHSVYIAPNLYTCLKVLYFVRQRLYWSPFRPIYFEYNTATYTTVLCEEVAPPPKKKCSPTNLTMDRNINNSILYHNKLFNVSIENINYSSCFSSFSSFLRVSVPK